MHKNYLLIVLFNLIILNSILNAQEKMRVEFGTGEKIIEDLTPKSAYDCAVENALNDAISKLGIHISSFQVLMTISDKNDYDVFVKSINTKTKGKILDYDIVQKDKVPITNTFMDKWVVTVKAKIAIDTLGSAFDITAGFVNDRIHYNEGDEIQIRIQSAKDCYLYIFHLYELHKAVLWMPDEKWFGSNYLPANMERIIPAPSEIPILISITPGYNFEFNHIIIIATDQDIGFSDKKRPNEKSYYETDLFKINKWLSNWDDKVQRAEFYLPFVIHSKEK